MNYAELFQPLWADILDENEFYNKKPILSHYTSLSTFENILKNNELWLANPLFMNDFEEFRFGLLEGTRFAKSDNNIREALNSDYRMSIFTISIDYLLSNFEKNHLLDTYIFCFSEHEPGDIDGKLSMWRGYGKNGKGVALVFDTSKLAPSENTPIILASVQYGSAEERYKWIEEKLAEFAIIVKNANIPDEEIYQAAHSLFERIKLFSIFTKHHGFSEEREWRLVYQIERDTKNILSKMLGYSLGENGVEPKLKLKLDPIPGIIDESANLDNLIHSIILGPTASSELSKRSVCRMLEILNKNNLIERIRASTIPFRIV